MVGCRKRRLNQALFVPSFLVNMFSVIAKATLIVFGYVVFSVFGLMANLVRLSVPVQVTELERLVSEMTL